MGQKQIIYTWLGSIVTNGIKTDPQPTMFRVYSVWPRRDICPFSPVIYGTQRGHCVCMRRKHQVFWAMGIYMDWRSCGAYNCGCKNLSHTFVNGF